VWCQYDLLDNCRRSAKPSDDGQTVQIQGSVGQGGRNATTDVRAIQAALNRVGTAAGGPTPPLNPDGLCGPLTKAAIGRFQQVQFQGALRDSRVDPGQRTLARLNLLLSGARGASGQAIASPGTAAFQLTTAPAPVGAQTTPDQLDRARSLAPDAARRIRAAIARLNSASVALVTPSPSAAQKQLIREIDWHFKASAAPAPAAHMARIAAVYTFMQVAIDEFNLGIRELFRGGTHPDPTAIAFASLGGFFSLDPSERFIFITPAFRTAGSGVIVHELAHFCGGNATSGRDIVHRASPKPPPRGKQGTDGSTDYAGMTPFFAQTNVFSYQIYCFPEIPEFKVP
jgi:peptidoglycan hydrolase-like protein with peptidoglycan-binding domain